MKIPRLYAWILFVAAAGASLLLGALNSGGEHHRSPLFWPLFGFLGASILIWGARALGRLLIEKSEKYYDEP